MSENLEANFVHNMYLMIPQPSSLLNVKVHISRAIALVCIPYFLGNIISYKKIKASICWFHENVFSSGCQILSTCLSHWGHLLCLSFRQIMSECGHVLVWEKTLCSSLLTTPPTPNPELSSGKQKRLISS